MLVVCVVQVKGYLQHRDMTRKGIVGHFVQGSAFMSDSDASLVAFSTLSLSPFTLEQLVVLHRDVALMSCHRWVRVQSEVQWERKYLDL